MCTLSRHRSPLAPASIYPRHHIAGGIATELKACPFIMAFNHVSHCPVGWTCTGNAGIADIGADQFLSFGPTNDGVGVARSPTLSLPRAIERVVISRAGGADGGSGFFIRSSVNGNTLCSATNVPGTDSFSDDTGCSGLSAYAGMHVYIEVIDTSSSGDVRVRNIRFQDASGVALTDCDASGTFFHLSPLAFDVTLHSLLLYTVLSTLQVARYNQVLFW